MALAFIVFYVFKIRDSQVRIFVFLLVLIKPLFILTRLIDFSLENLYSYLPFFASINKLFGKIVNIQSIQNVDFVLVNSLIFGSYVFSFFLITIFRHYQLYFYFYRLHKTGVIVEVKNGLVMDAIGYYSERMCLKPPKIYYNSDLKNGFYTFGIIRKKIIINKVILDFLNEDEKEIILLHELAHIKRNDNILNTIVTFLADMHFYNPFSYIAYMVIKTEQEKDCDKLIMKYTNKSGKEIAVNILSSILKIKKNLSYFPEYCPRLASSFSIGKAMSEASLHKRIKYLINTDPAKINVNIYTKIFVYGFFLILLFL